MTEQEKKQLVASEGFTGVEQAGEFLGVKRSKIYELMNDGRLASVKLDGARRIPRQALRQFAESLVGAGN
jgi:excisionase family DNA binding protein